MAYSKIEINRGADHSLTNGEDLTQEMMARMDAFCKALLAESDKFDEQGTFNALHDYIKRYNRILYAPISNAIYVCHAEQEHKEKGKAGGLDNMTSNITDLLNYSQGEEIRKRIEETKNGADKRQLADTQKAIIKIWDHINLAQQQYRTLREGEEEHLKRIDQKLKPETEKIIKEVNAQMLTMVTIFTALAFLVFGGISSLDNIFSSVGLPLLKAMAIGAVWGLCILNLIFVFLFCAGKMTGLNFKSNDDPNASIFQRYRIAACNMHMAVLYH